MNLLVELLNDPAVRTLLGAMVGALLSPFTTHVLKKSSELLASSKSGQSARATSTRKSPAHCKLRSPGVSTLRGYAGRCARRGCVGSGRFVEAEKRRAGRGGKKMKIGEAYISYTEVGRSVRGRALANPRRVVDYMRDAFDERPDQEQLWVVLLDAKLRPIARSCVFVGTLDAVNPRGVLRMALLSSAHGFIVVHNHPSGDPAPSPQDVVVTETLRQGAQLVGVPMVDYIIVGTAEDDPNGKGFVSSDEAQ